MRYAPQFRDAFEVTDDDLEGMVAEIKKSDDDIVVDAILAPDGTRRFTGLAVTKVSSSLVRVGPGRLWYDGGGRYYADAAGLTLDLISLKPTLQKRIVAIVAYPDEKDDVLAYRDHETDAEAGTKVPEQVTTKVYRHARLEAVPGPEAVAPTAPVVTTALVVAFVTMGTAGIEGDPVANEAARLSNLGDVAKRTRALEAFADDAGPKIAALTSDLAGIQAKLAQIGNQELAYALASDVAEIKQKLDLPAAYVNYRADFFLDDSRTDRVATGTYGALTGEGLRFAPEAINETQLEPFNPYNPDVMITGDGLLLPAWDDSILFRPVKAQSATLALTQYAYETRSIVSLTMGRQRIRYGTDFEASTGSPFFAQGSLSAIDNGVQQVFRIGNETFQATNTGRVDASGHTIYRFAKFWYDAAGGPYWDRITTAQQIEGYAWFDTFIAPQDGWLVAIDPRVSAKPADGLLYVGICACNDGEPDIKQMLCLTSKPSSFWRPQTGLGGNKASVTPTFLKGGERYAYVLMTAAAYSVGASDNATGPTTGTMFYGMNGGVLHTDPLRHPMYDLYFAQFRKNRVEIDLKALSLSGGIAAIDVTAAAIVPGGTNLNYRVGLGGLYRSLAETQGLSLLSDLPPLAPFQVVLDGTGASMPGIRLTGSRVRVSRPKTTLHHVSDVLNLGASSSTIRVKSRLRNFDPAHHTRVEKILVGAGYATVETADLVQDVPRGNGIIERTSTFNLAGPVTSIKRVIDQTTDSAANLFVGDSATDIAL